MFYMMLWSLLHCSVTFPGTYRFLVFCLFIMRHIEFEPVSEKTNNLVPTWSDTKGCTVTEDG